jgi:glycogen debranching enzyme
MTIFGRDSLIVSHQNMLVHAPFALGALKKLAQYQATERDTWRDAEPGKMPHELRFGELAHFHQVPHTPYYGTADATIMYLIVLHETWKWLGDPALLREYRDVAVRCLEWIDRYGDLDDDGFQEYQTRSASGYENMGWKDASDAVVYPDGSQVPQPKALCELQGYVYDAKRRLAEVFDVLGEPDRAATLRGEAAELQRRFDAAYWCDDLGFYAFGLDPQKRPIKTVALNQGHLLWSGIVPPARAAQVVRRFFEDDMWSGWGIRTLSAANPAYNPFSYQLGSVWPHDNGIIAQGFKRYGYAEEANRVARDIFEAASYFEGYRLPELYAGLPRRPGTFPVQYVGANIPQAWAAGSIFHLIQTTLGLRADAPRGRLYVAPTLPRWLPELQLSGLRVGRARLALRFWRDGETSRWEVTEQSGDLTVAEAPWTPLLDTPPATLLSADPASKPGAAESAHGSTPTTAPSNTAG